VLADTICKSVGVRLPRFESLTRHRVETAPDQQPHGLGQIFVVSGAIRPCLAVYGQSRPIRALASGPATAFRVVTPLTEPDDLPCWMWLSPSLEDCAHCAVRGLDLRQAEVIVPRC
jgi:hypothetical protein